MSETPFEHWCIVELMGHRKLAGKCTEENIAGANMLRIDIYPGDATEPKVTQFYGGSAIYCITPTTEEVCRRMGESLQPAPVSRYELLAPSGPSQDDIDKLMYGDEG